MELTLGELRKNLAEAVAASEPDVETIERLTGEIRSTDARLVAQKLLEPETTTTIPGAIQSSEERELAELRGKVEFGKYIGAALAGMPVMSGPELEYNQHLGIAGNYFPPRTPGRKSRTPCIKER